MTGRYFRSQVDYHAGPQAAREISPFLAETRRQLNEALASTSSDAKTRSVVVQQLRAVVAFLSDKLRGEVSATTPAQALKWVENALAALDKKWPGFGNLAGQPDFDSAYRVMYSVYDAMVSQAVADHPEAASLAAFEDVLVHMDALADQVAVYRETQTPISACGKPGESTDWLELLTSGSERGVK